MITHASPAGHPAPRPGPPDLADAFDGSPAGLIVFALDGAEYTIPLSEPHQQHLRELLEPYLGAARRTGSRRPRKADRR